MKPLYRNLLLLFGLVAIGLMIWKFDVPPTLDMRRAVLFMPIILAIWLVAYCCYAAVFEIIVNTGGDKHLDFAHSFKLTCSAFALTYATPFGFGGGPYRIMELSHHIGMPRAVSSTTLYSLMHIISHFCLWATGVVLFAVAYTEKMTPFFWVLFVVYLAVFFGALALFRFGYSNGLVERLFKLCLFWVPFVKGWARNYHATHLEAFRKADSNIIYLRERPKAFWSSLALEYAGRILTGLEYFLILRAFGITQCTFLDGLLVLCLASLLGNVLFILPMQIGAREGGIAIILKILYGISGAAAGSLAVFVAFYSRIRELILIILGIVLIKVGNKHLITDRAEAATKLLTEGDMPLQGTASA